jgi:hypothetical protein
MLFDSWMTTVIFYVVVILVFSGLGAFLDARKTK